MSDFLTGLKRWADEARRMAPQDIHVPEDPGQMRTALQRLTDTVRDLVERLPQESGPDEDTGAAWDNPAALGAGLDAGPGLLVDSGPFGSSVSLVEPRRTPRILPPPHPQRTGVFPVDLTQVDGAQGDEANPATWTYDVLDITTGDTLESDIDPVAAPHKWQRPAIGQMIAATFGYAHYEPNESDGYDMVLGWINEMVEQEACETASSE